MHPRDVWKAFFEEQQLGLTKWMDEVSFSDRDSGKNEIHLPVCLFEEKGLGCNSNVRQISVKLFRQKPNHKFK